MGIVVDLAQMVDAYFSVNLGCVQPGVPERLLDAPQVGPILHHPKKMS